MSSKKRSSSSSSIDLDSLATVELIQRRLNLAAKLLDPSLALLQQPQRLADNLGLALVAAGVDRLMNELLEIGGISMVMA